MSDLPWDHPANPFCYARVREQQVGEICVLCYYHALAFSKVRIHKHGDVAVCQECGNALATRCAFTPRVVKALMEIMLRRLILDGVLARSKQMLDDIEIDEHTVVH